MKSIDRLRRYVDCHDKITGLTATCINHLIDSIENEVDDMWHALTIDAKPMTDENMAESGWVRLPIDADGEHINVGDVMAYADNTKPMEVVALVPPAVFLTEDGPRYADMCCHYHATTVEDVLREFVERLDEIGSEDDCMGEAEQECRACIRRDIAAAYAEYAAKLRLAGEDA